MITSRDLAAYAKAKRLVIGSKTVLKKAKIGNIEKVIKSTNCPDNIKKDLEHYAKLSKFEIEDFSGDSKQFGEMCGKPFNVLLIGVKK